MKRSLTVVTRDPFHDKSIEILPRELWPVILSYLSMWYKRAYYTIGNAWGVTRGLVDQSIERVGSRDRRPSDLSRFVNLTSLETLYDGSLSEQLLNGTFSRLQCINLYAGKEGDFKEGEMVPLSSLPNLTSLKLDLVYFGFRYVLPHFSALTRLSIDCFETGGKPYKSADIETLSLLTTLTDLTLVDTKVPDATVLSMTQLKRLSLSGNKWITEKSIKEMALLHTLELHGNLYTWKYDVDVFRRLTNLTRLELDENCQITDIYLTHLTGLLSLGASEATELGSSILSHLSSLTRLVLCNGHNDENGCQDKDLPANLLTLTRLRELHFGSDSKKCLIRDEHLMCLTSLTSLHIERNQSITNMSISRLTNLITLRLTYDRIGAYPFYSAITFPLSLRELDFHHSTNWAGVIHTTHTRLTNLTKLRFGYQVNAVEFEQCLLEISRLPLLKELTYHSTSEHGFMKGPYSLLSLSPQVEVIKMY